MINNVPTYLLYSTAVLLSGIISMYAVKKIIFITRHKGIFDIPDNIRKIHGADIPSLGGIGIFVGYMVVAAFFMGKTGYPIIAASVLLFFTGIYDDIMNMRPSKKLLAQLIAASMPVLIADIRIASLQGIAGITELPYVVSVASTILLCTFFINVFNFMDGIDGLACTLAILYTGILGAMFAAMGHKDMACVALSLTGATMGLLYYNRAPAKIYMGDTGSMLLGFMIFTLAVLLIKATTINSMTGNALAPAQLVMLLISVVFIPVYDALRVFVLRAAQGISPLRADRTHLHYYLLDAGFSHSGAVAVIAVANVVLTGIVWLLQDQPAILQLSIMVVFTTVLVMRIASKRRAVLAAANTIQ